jgi:hypothetical protein
LKRDNEVDSSGTNGVARTGTHVSNAKAETLVH